MYNGQGKDSITVLANISTEGNLELKLKYLDSPYLTHDAAFKSQVEAGMNHFSLVAGPESRAFPSGVRSMVSSHYLC